MPEAIDREALYRIADTREIVSPAVLVYRDLLAANLERMVALAGDPARLRPHCKTHKMRQVTRMEMALGITRHKCATFAEAEMLAEEGVRDIFLSYNLVGPNIARAVAFRRKFPQVELRVQADHSRPIELLGAAMAEAGLTIDVLLDIDVGQHRTGVLPGPGAVELYRQIAGTPGLRAAGLSVYDGHQHQKSREDRAAAVDAEWHKVTELCAALAKAGLSVPRLLCGGTASFPIYAAKENPAIELSPGTCVFHDANYSEMFADLPFVPAVALLTRVISRPAADRVTLDLGYKAVASDPPAGKRVVFPALPDAEQVLQNEEHLVLRTPLAERFGPGDELYALPRHVCPTMALHKQAFVVAEGRLVDRWDIAARDRWLTI